MLEDSAVIL